MMSWDITNGFVPRTFDEILATLVTAVNSQYGTNYDTTTIQGTNIYKYFYAGIQVIMEAEQSVSDISGKLQEYIVSTNQKILQPRGAVDGFINFIKNDGVLNTEGSFAPVTDEDEAGTVKFAILLDTSDPDYVTKKNKLIEYFHKYLSVGLYYYSGVGQGFKGEWDEETAYLTGDIVMIGSVYYKALSENTNQSPESSTGIWEVIPSPTTFVNGIYKAVNGQNFYYGFFLPRYYQMESLTITLPISANNNNYVMTQKEVQDLFTENFIKYMVLGKNLEPESIASVKDFNFASQVKYQGVYLDENGTEHSFTNTPTEIDFDVKFRPMDPSNIVVVYE